MSDPTPILALDAAVVIVGLAWPRSRHKLIDWCREIRRLLIENPLRIVTGRRRPDYARIAYLERSELP